MAPYMENPSDGFVQPFCHSMVGRYRTSIERHRTTLLRLSLEPNMTTESTQLVINDESPRGRPPVAAATKAAFLAALASAKPGAHPFHEALKAANISRATVFRLRKDPAFEADFQRALTARVGDVADAIHSEAIDGTPILDEGGKEIGRRRNTRLLERLGEQHGLLPSSRPAVAVQVNQNSPVSADRDLTPEQRERLRELLHRRVIEGSAVEVPSDDGSDLI
jgi:hypothetical protein